MSTTATVSAPSLECGCGRVIELGARKIGDSVKILLDIDRVLAGDCADLQKIMNETETP